MVLGQQKLEVANMTLLEPGTNEEIKTSCTRKYNVTFSIFANASVKGKVTP
jgi:glutathione peroxidase-family protein